MEENCVCCFLCKNNVDINLIRNHFEYAHKYIFIKSNSVNTFYCIENECNSSFANFRNYLRHIHQYHINISVQNINERPQSSNLQNIDPVESNLQVQDVIEHDEEGQEVEGQNEETQQQQVRRFA